jgi:hypothetical protein
METLRNCGIEFVYVIYIEITSVGNPKYRSDPATKLQGSYTAIQQDQAIGTVLVRVVIRAKSRA